MNLLLRNYLAYNLYDQADKLVSKATFPESASNNEWARYLFYLGKPLNLLNSLLLFRRSYLAFCRLIFKRACFLSIVYRNVVVWW